MLPSEKAERWVRRVGFTALILIALYIVVWLVGFIGRIAHQAVNQRAVPMESDAPLAEGE